MSSFCSYQLAVKNNTPRRKRLNRTGRLARAKDWIKTYRGKKLVKGYSKWFGVDMLCALHELKLSGVSFAPDYEEHFIRTYHQRIETKRKKKQLKALESVQSLVEWESDEYHAFIMGYTSGGASFGVTHEQWAKANNESTPE